MIETDSDFVIGPTEPLLHVVCRAALLVQVFRQNDHDVIEGMVFLGQDGGLAVKQCQHRLEALSAFLEPDDVIIFLPGDGFDQTRVKPQVFPVRRLGHRRQPTRCSISPRGITLRR
jgi:hypothetical protein